MAGLDVEREPGPPILLVLEGLFHYSDILRGELIRELAQRHRTVVVTPDIDAPAAARYGYFQHPNLAYRRMVPSRPRLWTFSDQYLRKFFVRSYDHLANTRFAFYRSRNFTERLLGMIGAMLPAGLLTPARATRLEATIARPSRAFRELLREVRPRLMVTPTPGYQYLPLVAEAVVFAARLGLPTVAVNCSFDNPYTQPKFLRKTDYIFVWNDRMAREVGELHGYAPERISVVGCLKFDHYFRDIRGGRMPGREAFLRSKGLDPAKKTVLFAAPTPSTWRKFRREMMETVVGLKRERHLDGDPNILVRLHPFERWEEYRSYAGIPGFAIELAGTPRPDYANTAQAKVELTPKDLLNQTATFAHSDLAMNYSSTTLVEACIFDKPVVSIGWPELARMQFETEVPAALLSTGAARLASNPSQMRSLINQYLSHPELDREQRLRVVREYVQFTDGRTAERTAEKISELAAKRAPFQSIEVGLQ